MRVREKMSAPKMVSMRSAGAAPPLRGRAGVVTCAWTSEVKGGRERRQDNRVGGGSGAGWCPTFLSGLGRRTPLGMVRPFTTEARRDTKDSGGPSISSHAESEEFNRFGWAPPFYPPKNR